MEHLYRTTIILKDTLSAEELADARKQIISCYANQNGIIRDSGDGENVLLFATDDEDMYYCMALANLEIDKCKPLLRDCFDSWFIEYEDEPWESTDLLLEAIGCDSTVHFKEWVNPCADMENLYETTIILKDTLSPEELSAARERIIDLYANRNGVIKDSGDGKYMLRFIADDEDGYGCMALANVDVGKIKDLVMHLIESWTIKYKDEPWENTDALEVSRRRGADWYGWKQEADFL